MKFRLLTESMLNLAQRFNLDIDDVLTESKADELRLIQFAGEDLAKRFIAIKNRFKSPENDLYYWIKGKTPEDLEVAVTNMENTISSTQQKRQMEAGADFVGENDQWKVYHITTYEASQKYGRDTRWCITGVDGYGRKYWDDYINSGVDFYFYISKDKINPRGRFGKYALALSPNDEFLVYDQQDNEAYGVPNAPVINGLPDVRTVDLKHYVYDGNEVPDNLNRTTIETIDIAEDVDTIKFATFYDFANLQRVVIPNNVIKVGPCAFRACTNLKSVVMSEGVEVIEDLVFLDCKALETVTLPSTVKEISPHAFHGCNNITICCDEGSYAEQFAKEHNIKIMHNEDFGLKFRAH